MLNHNYSLDIKHIPKREFNFTACDYDNTEELCVTLDDVKMTYAKNMSELIFHERKYALRFAKTYLQREYIRFFYNSMNTSYYGTIINRNILQDINTNTLRNTHTYLFDENEIIFSNILDVLNTLHFIPSIKQQDVIRKVIAFIVNSTRSAKAFGLFGYAGTGKTTMITSIIICLLYKKYIRKVTILSPTNAALSILTKKVYEKLNHINDSNYLKQQFTFMTIDQYFGVKKRVNKYGDSEYTSLLIDTPGAIAMNEMYTNDELIIVDECSMINSNKIEVFKNLMKYNYTKYIFLGDEAQLPPVNETISKVFNDDDMIPYGYNRRVTLTDVLRTKNNDLLDLVTDIRKYISIQKPLNLRARQTSNIFYDSDVNEWINHVVNYINSIKDTMDIDFTVLAYSNNTCDKYNNMIRERLFGEDKNKLFMVNDILVVMDTYIIEKKTDTWATNKVKLYNSLKMRIDDILETDTVDILKINLNYNALEISSYPNLLIYVRCITDIVHTIQYYILSVKYRNNISDEICTENICVLDDHNQYLLNEYVKQVKLYIDKLNRCRIVHKAHNNAITAKELAIDKAIILITEALNKIQKRYIHVKYGYCTTIHKEQGNQKKVIFVDVDNIRACNKHNRTIYYKTIYTAFTRAIEKLYILHS